MKLRLKGNSIRLRLTQSEVERLVSEGVVQDQVGIESDVDGLRIIVEKDFACLKPRPGEDESDMFPNPDPGVCE